MTNICSKQKPNTWCIIFQYQNFVLNVLTIKKISEFIGCSFKLVASGRASLFVKAYTCLDSVRSSDESDYDVSFSFKRVF